MVHRSLLVAGALGALLAAPLSAQDASSRITTTGVLLPPGVTAPGMTAAVASSATDAPAPLVAQAALPPGSNAVLRTGTEVSLTLLHELTTKGKRLRNGDRVRLEVAEPVVINGAIVIPQGSPVAGEITEVRNKGMWGRSGRFVVRLLNVNANGRQIRLGGTFDDKGKAGGWGAAAVSALVFLPAGFFMTGTSALLPAGTTVKAFIDEDVPLALPASAAPAPMVVPAPALVVVPVSATEPAAVVEAVGAVPTETADMH